MADFLTRLTSRKFLLTLSAVIALIAAGRYAEAVGALTAYLVSEGAVDVASITKAKAEIDKAASVAVAQEQAAAAVEVAQTHAAAK